MPKELSTMTLEELWELFPITLKEYNNEYPKWYEMEKEKLVENFDDGTIVRINHIGSTAVPGIISKPTIDILMEISFNSNISQITDKLKSMQWGLMNFSEKPTFKQTYNKGYTKYGFAEKVYHLHVRYTDNWSELYFRDYLIEHPEVAKEYVDLKRQLKEKYEHNRDAYTNAKEEFVNMYSQKAKLQYGDRYKTRIKKMEIN
nr:GrpB family protein [uncultured Aminipila sp.]